MKTRGGRRFVRYIPKSAPNSMRPRGCSMAIQVVILIAIVPSRGISACAIDTPTEVQDKQSILQTPRAPMWNASSRWILFRTRCCEICVRFLIHIKDDSPRSVVCTTMVGNVIRVYEWVRSEKTHYNDVRWCHVHKPSPSTQTLGAPFCILQDSPTLQLMRERIVAAPNQKVRVRE